MIHARRTADAEMKLPRQFGVGPIGIVSSAALLAVAIWAARRISVAPLFANPTIPRLALLAGIVISILMVVWSVRSLPVQTRGLKVCAAGPYRYVRHPVYAAFSTIGALGLALYANSPIFLLWFVAIQPLWNWLVRFEEQAMLDGFGEEYEHYMEHTGRLFPRFGQRSSEP